MWLAHGLLKLPPGNDLALLLRVRWAALVTGSQLTQGGWEITVPPLGKGSPEGIWEVAPVMPPYRRQRLAHPIGRWKRSEGTVGRAAETGSVVSSLIRRLCRDRRRGSAGQSPSPPESVGSGNSLRRTCDFYPLRPDGALLPPPSACTPPGRPGFLDASVSLRYSRGSTRITTSLLCHL